MVAVGASLIAIVIRGTLVGSTLPFILRRRGLDACTSFVAILVDVTGPMIYFSVAYIFLRGTLL